MRKNEEYVVKITDLGSDGEGVGHVVSEAGEPEGFTVFVKDAIVGDVARVLIVKAKKSYAYGRLMELVVPSPYRVEAPCANARRCGGCTIMEMDYGEQLSFKRSKVISCLERIGGQTGVSDITEAAHGMESPYHFRNKMQFPVGLDRAGKVQIGFYAGRTHSIIDLEDCVIGHAVNKYLMKHLRDFLQREVDEGNRDIIYDEESNRGILRHILTRVGFATGELMVCFVINAESLGKAEAGLLHAVELAVEEYRSALAGENRPESGDAAQGITLTSVTCNINKEKTNRILGDRCKTIFGQDYIADYIGDIRFHISPQSFFQVNPVQTKALYDKALEYANLSGGEVVWDMYCGIGTISLSMARAAKQVYGVEIVSQAIEDARENARRNGFDNVEFFCGKAEEIVPLYMQGKLGDKNEGCTPDVVVVDPPRKGCDAALLDTICEMNPKRLVYVSCDPATLARDVKLLTQRQFTLEKVAVYDQFCHSAHVESVCLLSKIQT